jgi:hypothetical protein
VAALLTAVGFYFRGDLVARPMLCTSLFTIESGLILVAHRTSDLKAFR